MTHGALGVLMATLLVAARAWAVPGVTESEIVIGCSTPLSGPLAFTGEHATKYGVDLFVKALNDAGGIHGRKIRTVYEDDAYDRQKAVANTKKLVEADTVFAVVAPLGTAPVVAALDYLERKAVPLVFPLDGSPVTRGRKYVFSGTMLYDRQSKVMIDYLAGQRKVKSFGVLFEDDPYGRTFRAAFEKDLARHGLKATAEPLKPGTTDLGALGKLRAANPEVTLLVLTPVLAAQVLNERKRINWDETTMVSAGLLTDDRYLGLAATAGEGVEGLVLWPDPRTSDLAGVKLYRDRMTKYFPKTDVSRYSLAGYFAGMLFAEGARRAGRTLTREGFTAALESMTAWDSGILPPITIGPDHETQKQAYWIKVEKGRVRTVTDWLKSD